MSIRSLSRISCMRLFQALFRCILSEPALPCYLELLGQPYFIVLELLAACVLQGTSFLTMFLQ